MFLKRFAVLTAALALGFAACSGAGTNVVDPLPHGTAVSSSGAAVAGTGVSGITSSVTVIGSGNVNASESSTPPGSTPALSSLARAAGATTQSEKPDAAAVAQTVLVYVTLTASSTTSISGFGAASFTFANAPTGTPFLAFFNTTTSKWQTLGNSGTISGNTVTFGASTFSPAIALAAGASLNLAVYTGQPTLTVADTGFEGTVAPIGTAIGSTGWTQCSVTSIANAGTFSGGLNGTVPYVSATAFPLSTFTPSASETPLAAIVAGGAAAPAAAATQTPVPAATTAPVHGGTHAAQFGGLFNTFSAGDVRYNGLCQNIAVPVAGAHLSAFVLSLGDQQSSTVENLIGTLSGTSLTSILYMENVTTPTSAGDSAYRAIGPIAVPSGTTTLFIGQATTQGTTGASTKSSYWWFDDLSIVSP